MRVDRVLTVKIPELTPKQWRGLEKQLTYLNDQGDVVISYKRLIRKGVYVLPRGAWYLMPDEITYEDKRTRPSMPALDFALTLDDTEKDKRFAGQIAALKSMVAQEQGIVVRPPGTGKTEIATAFMAGAQTRSLVLVHTEDILDQWLRRIEKNIPELAGKVGVIRGKECRIGHVTVATVQTLSRSYLDRPAAWWGQWGALIADEGHHVAAPTWEAVINTCPAFYRFAFTASPSRADGMHPSMRFIVGPIIHRTKFSSPIPLEVVPVKTNFNMRYRGAFDWGRLLNKLVDDDERNGLIAKTATREAEAGNSILILSRRISHLERIAEKLHSVDGLEILTGKRSSKDRKRVLSDFRSGKVRVLLATQLADEALDVQRLNRVLLVHPGKAEGRLVQQIGRALRSHPDKKDAVIFDFIDHKIGVLRRQWNERKRAYKKNGISIRPSGFLKIGGRRG